VTARAEEAVAAVASGGGFLVARCLFGGFDASVRWSLWGDWATCVLPFILFPILFYIQKFILLHKSIKLRRRLRPYCLKGKRGVRRFRNYVGDLEVHQYIHQGFVFLDVSVQSQHLWWLEFRLGEGGKTMLDGLWAPLYVCVGCGPLVWAVYYTSEPRVIFC
jgi:hypothetical protein